LIGGVFSALPAGAQEPAPVAIPPTVQIEDPFGDGNYLNDQGNGGTSVGGQEVIPSDGDHTTPADASTVGDVGKIWFENDAKDISVFVQTEVPVTANGPALVYDVFTSPGEGSVASNTFWCLRFSAIVPGHFQGQSPTWEGGPVTKIVDRCNVGSNYWSNSVDGTQEILSGPDGTGIVKMTFPRSFSPWLADGQKLTTPYARAANAFGSASQQALLSAPQVDNTKAGTDYTIVSGGPVVAPAPGEEPPGKSDPPGKGKKKGCKKGKGKKKGACKGAKAPKPPAPPASPACPAYVPGEEGKDAEIVVVTDAATEEAPVEVPLEIGGGIGVGGVFEDAIAHAYKNVQVDSASASTGLYVRLEMPYPSDYDLYVRNADGSEAARAAGFNPEPAVYNDNTAGGHTEPDAEQIDGVTTADCGGYTIDAAAATGEGGELTLKFWLGEATYSAGGGENAFDTFWTLVGTRDADSDRASGTPAAKKGCKKGKGKKKGCTKPPVQSCAPYAPGELGTDKPLVTVTDAATAEAPVEQTITLAESVADVDLVGAASEPSYDYFNVQVDSAAPSAGLYATFEFDTRRDYDLYARWPDASEAASSHGFNSADEAEAPEPVPFDPSNQRTNHAGESKADSENLVGLITSDCGGYTIEVVNWLGEGGDFTVKLWLGEGTTEPLAPGERPA